MTTADIADVSAATDVTTADTADITAMWLVVLVWEYVIIGITDDTDEVINNLPPQRLTYGI